MPEFSIDVFCRVVDNYGDIGVCWRLAQQLSAYGPTRLFVDDLGAFARIVPKIDPLRLSQQLNKVRIEPWPQAETATPAEVVIETFACELPETYQLAMPGHSQLWLNLEYLSAEAWVEDLHLMPSPQTNGINKYFFFPGFTEKTGGLLRPPTTPKAVLANDFWTQHKLSPPTTERIAFVFPYPNAPLETLYQSLEQSKKSWTVLLAATAPKPKQAYQHLSIKRLPFIDQNDFDALLELADLNIIRGEDSFVRAIWTAKPFIWQPYIQEENIHLTKLDAWLTQSDLDASIQQLIRSWSTNTVDPQLLHNTLENLTLWQQQSQSYAQKLAQQKDVVSQLYAFCSQKLQKAVK